MKKYTTKISQFGELILKIQLTISLFVFIFASNLQIDRLSIFTSSTAHNENKIISDTTFIVKNAIQIDEQKKTLIKPHLNLSNNQTHFSNYFYQNKLHSINLTKNIFHPPKFS